MVAQALVQLVRACASLAACYMFASLYPEIRRVQRTKTTGVLQLLPILAMLANCVCWGLYGLLRADYFPLVATNVVGVGFSLFYTAVYYQNAPEPRIVLRKTVATAVALALLTLYALASTQPAAMVQNNVGYVAMGVCAIMFGAPLLTVREVLATKNTAVMPFSLIVAGFVNCLLWLLYGLILEDAFVIAPNLVNLFLGALQLALFAVFPQSAAFKYDKVGAKRRDSADADATKRDAIEDTVTSSSSSSVCASP